MKNILIIGGSYFAGRILVEELINEEGYSIYVFNRGNRPLKMEKVSELVGDREKKDDIRTVIPAKEWDVLVDFCAYAPEHISTMIANLPGTVKQYIYISTTTVYENTLDLPVREDASKLSKPQPELGHYSDYGLKKWLAEQKLESECKGRQIAYTTLRPSIVYGEYNYAPRETYFFDLIRDNKPVVIPEMGLAMFSFVWVVDLARVIIGCLGNGGVFNQAFNVAAEDLVSYPRLVEVLKEISGKEIQTVRLGMDEINRRRIPLPFPLDDHLIYSGGRIQEALGFQYTPFVEGMRKTYKYYEMVQQARKTQ